MPGQSRLHRALAALRPHARPRRVARVGVAILVSIVLSASLARLALAASPLNGGSRPCVPPPGHQYGVGGILPPAQQSGASLNAPAHQYGCPPRRGR